MSRLLIILQGWFFYFFRNKKVESKAMFRKKICLECEHSKFYNNIRMWEHIEFKKPKTESNTYCTKCSNCPIAKKIRSPKEKCPIGKW